MPKVSGSYHGITMQPQFPTYQTAGMLQPAAQPPVASPAPTPPPQTPMPPPVTPPISNPGPITGGVGGITPQAPAPLPFAPQAPAAPERQRLVDALLSTQSIEV